ncbi:MAG: hypothetical protein IRZ03_15970 [Acidobacterium ailaaui]|nr:hypothetical protein [Pseudacidobacterium ailaaui]
MTDIKVIYYVSTSNQSISEIINHIRTKNDIKVDIEKENDYYFMGYTFLADDGNVYVIVTDKKISTYLHETLHAVRFIFEEMDMCHDSNTDEMFVRMFDFIVENTISDFMGLLKW